MDTVNRRQQSLALFDTEVSLGYGFPSRMLKKRAAKGNPSFFFRCSLPLKFSGWAVCVSERLFLAVQTHFGL
jgi:hypothetical protein